jgi:Phenazine biosynthesis-like protein
VTGPEGGPATVWMDQSAPRFGAPVRDRGGLAASLGLSEGDLVPGEPALVVSTGAAHLLVPARDRGTVDRAEPDAPRLAAALRGAGGEGCYRYSRDPVDVAGAVAYARFFNPVMGISEDPATGTAAGPLVLGGDCSLLIGAGLALASRGRYGLVHLGGHTDFRHPGNSTECFSLAGEDLAAAVGLHWPAVADLDGARPYFRTSAPTTPSTSAAATMTNTWPRPTT